MDPINIAPDDFICSMDRISNLPEDVFRHIVSYLSAKEAACLKCAKNWKNLITIEPEIVFDLSLDIVDINGSLFAQPADYRVRKFSLKLQSTDLDPSQYNLVNDCLRNVLKRGVLDLELDINVKGYDYPLPFEVLTCESIAWMKLGSGFVIDIVPMNALLPALNTLLLDSVRFYDLGGCAFTKLLSACPVLEELVIDGFNSEDWKWSRIVSSLTLKRLTIRRGKWRYWEYNDSETLSFVTPNLAYLEYSHDRNQEYPVVDLNSLVEAKLNLRTAYRRDNNNLKNLILGLKNVQNLRLDNNETAIVFLSFHEVLPEFKSMTHLSIPTTMGFCWKDILMKFPKLKSFTIEALHYGGNINDKDLEPFCEWLLGQIEVLTITKFSGTIREMLQIKHILNKSCILELLEIHVQARREAKKLQILKDLLSFPRTSPECVVKVDFS